MEKAGNAHAGRAGNRFNRMEWAGAFGDLGTLIPFTVAYVSVLRMDPSGILFAFGLAMVGCGLFYGTPVPVQPMKAIGAVATTQAAQTLVITPQMVYGAGIVTGIIWLILGLSGAARYVSKLIARPVALGIILGLGFSFMLDGLKMMAGGWLLGGTALVGTLLLLANRVVPAMLLLLVFGAVAAVWSEPVLLSEFSRLRAEFRAPAWALSGITWNDLLIATLFLALPQLPLTLGNAIIAITEENNRLFPERAIDERAVSVSTGLVNLVGAPFGGVPMCHGAGGMAGHTRFGANTGGAVIILGAILLILALFFSASIETIFKIVPQPVLGVILFLTGAQLALGTCGGDFDKKARFVMLATAGFAMWNVGAAFVFGMLLDHLMRRDWVRL